MLQRVRSQAGGWAVVVACLAAVGAGGVAGGEQVNPAPPASAPSSNAADDAPDRRRVEQVASERAEFEITVTGTADHRRMGGWKEDARADHNPTRWLKITNLGDRPVINPRVTVEGGPDWFDIDHIIGEFVRPGMRDEEKSFALWQWIRLHLDAGPTVGSPLWGETRSMTRFMNTFGTGACGTYHTVMPVIGKQAGLRTFSGCFADCSHAVQQEFYDGQERYFDAHIPHQNGQPGGWFALKLNNAEIAGVAEIMEDRYLIDRAGGGPERFGYVAYFGPGCKFHEEKDRRDPRDMGMTLRPGESIRWSWRLEAPPWQPGDGTAASGKHGSGDVEFVPRLSEGDVRRDAAAIANVRFVAGHGAATVTPDDSTAPAELIYRVYCPYPMTQAGAAGQFDVGAGGRVTIACSFDGIAYAALWESAERGPQSLDLRVPDDPRFHDPKLTHELWFRATLEGRGTAVRQLRFREAFQAYRPSLPSLYAGRNVIRYRSQLGLQDNVALAVTRAAELGLVNGGFEQDAAPGETPKGWTAFGRSDGAHAGTWYAGTKPAEGRVLYGAAADWDVKDGGIYQRLQWRAGSRVNAAVYVITPGDSTVSSGCRIGLDPAGGTDPQASSVVWSDPARSKEWKRIETGPVTLPAGDRQITVFLAHKHATDGGHFNVTGFDGCVLEDVEAQPAAAARESPRDRVVVEYHWRDLPDLPVPRAPQKPVHPAKGGRFGFNDTLRWSPAPVDGSVAIDNYEICISARPDLAWPVMPNTHRLTGSGEPAFALVVPDVLRDGTTYYWRVRGRSADGVWGEWSETWSFVAAGPGAPWKLAARYDPETGSTTLTWEPPPTGTAVDHYEIYASGEHGFSPLRAAEKADSLGKQADRPATFAGTTSETTWDASGRPEVFYRVTAVDADGNRSVPTSIVKLPSPALLPMTLPPAVVGELYKAKLVARLRTGRYALSLSKGVIVDGADEPKFSLVEAEAIPWLAIDPAGGELSGKPPASAVGKQTITVRLEDGRDGACARQYQLQVVKARSPLGRG